MAILNLEPGVSVTLANQEVGSLTLESGSAASADSEGVHSLYEGKRVNVAHNGDVDIHAFSNSVITVFPDRVKAKKK